MKKLVALTALVFCGAAVNPRPSWVDKLPVNTAETVYFKGLADSAAGAADAEKAALRDLHARVALYILAGVRASDKETTRAVQQGTGGKVSNQFVSEFYTEIETYTDMTLSQIEAETYSEAYGPASKRLWRAWAQGAVSRKKLETESAEYPKRISAQYTRRIAAGGNLAADIRNRQSIIEDMAHNPLHQATAQFKLPDGEVNLYDYLTAQIKEWAHTIEVAPIPAQKARKGETLTLPVKTTSAQYKSLGQIEYRISLSRVSGGASLEYRAPAIDTAALATGIYRGRVDLRLSALSPVLQDITREFSLEVTLPAPPDKALAPAPFGGKWSGTMAYSEKGQSYRDSYTVLLYADGSCWAAVTAQDGEAQSALGNWSADNDRFRLNVDFKNPALARLHALNWAAIYDLQNNNRELRFRIKPAPDYTGEAILLRLNKEK